MAAAARGDDQRRRYGQRRRGPCAVFHAYLHWASTPQRLASHSSWVDPQVMPGGLCWERDTRLSSLLVAESEPDHDETTSLPDRHPGFSPGVLVPSYKSAGLQAKHSLRGGAAGGGAVAIGRRHAREVKDDGQAAARRLGQPGRAAVRGDQAVHDGQAEPGT